MKKIIIPILLICLLLCSCQMKEEVGILKNITISVIANEKTEDFKIETSKAYLGDALKEHNLIEGKQEQYGLFITSVNGIEADREKEEWWCITKGNNAVMTGVDSTPISDGDKFELTLKTGY